jgi:F-type H+-transporting ATPase subunit a
MSVLFGSLDVPPINHLIRWPAFWFADNKYFAVNKVVLLMWIAILGVGAFYLIAGRSKSLVPSGVQNLAETAVEFVQDGIINQTMGPDGLGWTPLLLTMFSFIFALNIFEVIPIAQMPVNARMAVPLLLALMVWVLYNAVGIKHQGFLGYFKNIMFPPGVPVFLYILVTPIELVSTILVRPLSLSVRLFANMLAGHLILVTFAVMTSALLGAGVFSVLSPFTFLLLVGLTGFEVLVAFLQAFIFTILTGVYLGGALHPEH